MKNFCLFSAILLICLFNACGNDDDVTTTSGSGLLIHLEKAHNDVFYEWTDIMYDENQRVNSIAVQFENFQQSTYEVTYDADVIITLEVTIDYQNSGNTSERNYDLIRQGDEITLEPMGEGPKYVLQTSDGFINAVRSFFGPNDEYYNDTRFIRDSNNNIDTVAYYVTDASSTDLKVFEYTFSDHSSEFELPAAFNPVMDFSFAGFEAPLAEVLGLKISNDPPLKSSYWDAGGAFREENITASPVVENGKLQELSYQDASADSNNYLLKLSYD